MIHEENLDGRRSHFMKFTSYEIFALCKCLCIVAWLLSSNTTSHFTYLYEVLMGTLNYHFPSILWSPHFSLNGFLHFLRHTTSHHWNFCLRLCILITKKWHSNININVSFHNTLEWKQWYVCVLGKIDLAKAFTSC